VPPAALFDFRDPLPMPAGAARLVAAVVEAAPRVGLLLGLACGRSISVTCPGVRRVSLVEVATPGAVWTPVTCGLADPGVLLIPAEAAVALADLYLGGLGEPEERSCNSLEKDLLVRHTFPALRPLAAALADHGVTTFQPGQLSDEPLPSGGGEVVAIALDVVLPLGQTVRVTLCMPAKSLLPSEVEAALAIPSPAANQALGDVVVDVSLRLSAATVSAEDVEDLCPGDVIRLDSQAMHHLLGVLAGDGLVVPVLAASLGRRGKNRAVVVHALTGGQ
jgi:flagellar motor switch/type III secretory pathway protein FliN